MKYPHCFSWGLWLLVLLATGRWRGVGYWYAGTSPCSRHRLPIRRQAAQSLR